MELDIYLAGGALRDELLGLPVHDRDFVVLHADEAAFLSRFPDAKRVGKKKECTYIVHGDEYTLSPAAAIEADLMLRDLTINALARGRDGRMHHHPATLDDIKGKRLRPVSRQNFLDDPLRVFRAARFWAKLPDFSVTDDLLDIMRDTVASGGLESLAAERVGQEARKACRASRPGNFIRLLARTSALDFWFPESASMDMERTARLMDDLAGQETDVWMALCHGLPPGPDQDSSQAIDLGKRIMLPNSLIRAGDIASRWIQNMADYAAMPPDGKVKLLLLLNRLSLIPNLARLALALHGIDPGQSLARDLEAVLAVSLPSEQRNLGPESGRILHALRIRALESL